MSFGVSFIVCCHNSSRRLPPTLAHLAKLRNSQGTPWEVLVVDNASTDDTAEVAKRHWPMSHPVPLRILREPRVGKSYALNRGFAEARYEVLNVVDDDNWLSPQWLEVVLEIMRRHPEVGACGGSGTAVFESQPPSWFEQYRDSYAVGNQAGNAGDVTWTRGYLWGAGMGIRRSAWRQLIDNGFEWQLPCRQGKKLTGGGDAELCFALRLAGWRLWYDPRLHFSHFVPAERLKWSYLRRLQRGFGASTVGHDPYDFALNELGAGGKRLEHTWQWQAWSALRRVLANARNMWRAGQHGPEGDPNVLGLEHALGRLGELLRKRGRYNQTIREISHAPWRRPCYFSSVHSPRQDQDYVLSSA